MMNLKCWLQKKIENIGEVHNPSVDDIIFKISGTGPNFVVWLPKPGGRTLNASHQYDGTDTEHNFFAFFSKLFSFIS